MSCYTELSEDDAYNSIANPSRPKSMGFTGSEEFIRLQFEEYLLALIASVRYKLFLEKQDSDPKALLADVGKSRSARQGQIGVIDERSIF